MGRNDPCWCGSGKKYKHCHMREDMKAGRVGGPQGQQAQGGAAPETAQAQGGQGQQRSKSRKKRRRR